MKTAVHLRASLIVVILAVLVGCDPPTAKQRLTGRWKGAPNVSEAVTEAVNTAAQGQKVNKLAEGAANFFGNLLANATMSVELDLRESGAAFYRGNTAALGFPADSDGKWEIVSANPDLIELRLTAADQQLPAKAILRTNDEFTLKFDSQLKDDKTGEEKTVATAVVFKRMND